MAKYRAFGMNTGFGNKTYVIMMWDGTKWQSSRPVRYYKTLKTANKAIEKIKKR
jgi:hypothetical protein